MQTKLIKNEQQRNQENQTKIQIIIITAFKIKQFDFNYELFNDFKKYLIYQKITTNLNFF